MADLESSSRRLQADPESACVDATNLPGLAQQLSSAAARSRPCRWAASPSHHIGPPSDIILSYLKPSLVLGMQTPSTSCSVGSIRGAKHVTRVSPSALLLRCNIGREECGRARTMCFSDHAHVPTLGACYTSAFSSRSFAFQPHASHL